MGAVVVVQQNFRGPTTSEWKNTEGIGVAERNGQTFFLVAYKKCASPRNILPPLKRDCSSKSYLESSSQQCWQQFRRRGSKAIGEEVPLSRAGLYNHLPWFGKWRKEVSRLFSVRLKSQEERWRMRLPRRLSWEPGVSEFSTHCWILQIWNSQTLKHRVRLFGNSNSQVCGRILEIP